MSREFSPCVYIMASGRNGTIYTGSTSAPVKRVWAHREGLGSRFTARYGCDRLVWFELHETMETAIQRELRIKECKRAWKLELIEAQNPQWLDLFDRICG